MQHDNGVTREHHLSAHFVHSYARVLLPLRVMPTLPPEEKESGYVAIKHKKPVLSQNQTT